MRSSQPWQEVADAMLAETIAAAPAGAATDAEAELYRRFAPRVRLFGLKHLREEAAAQDLVHQVFIVTLERLRAGEIRNAEAIGSFILGTSRTMASAQRKVGNRREALLDRFEDAKAMAAPIDAATLDLPRVARCLDLLPLRDRTILILTFYAEKPAPDIAAEVQLAPGAVRVARSRALARMRDCLSGASDTGRATPA
jgi:RNA polymerase sigma-70 factor (ECF subfamily)